VAVEGREGQGSQVGCLVMISLILVVKVEGQCIKSAPRKAAPIENKLHCSLEELYKGASKRMKISRETFDASGGEY